jgi:hypothetical protein
MPNQRQHRAKRGPTTSNTIAEYARELGIPNGHRLTCRSIKTVQRRTRRGTLMTVTTYHLVDGTQWFMLQRMTFDNN